MLKRQVGLGGRVWTESRLGVVVDRYMVDLSSGRNDLITHVCLVHIPPYSIRPLYGS
jgi:hypothetical protein